MKMSTYLAKPAEVERAWYVIDAAGKPLGRVAAQAAVLLRGKHKPTFTPNVDCGDHVIIINCKDAVLTGNKLTQKKWQRHTGYIGHLKETRYDILMATQLPISEEHNEKQIGRTIEVLCEGFDPVAEAHYGRSAADAPDIDGKVYFTAKKRIPEGSFVRVEITEALDYDLVGVCK
jgi:ribosomal protein L13